MGPHHHSTLSHSWFPTLQRRQPSAVLRNQWWTLPGRQVTGRGSASGQQRSCARRRFQGSEGLILPNPRHAPSHPLPSSGGRDNPEAGECRGYLPAHSVYPTSPPPAHRSLGSPPTVISDYAPSPPCFPGCGMKGYGRGAVNRLIQGWNEWTITVAFPLGLYLPVPQPSQPPHCP